MQDSLIKHPLIQILDNFGHRLQVFSVAKEDSNVGVWTWVGLISNHNAMSPQSNALAKH